MTTTGETLLAVRGLRAGYGKTVVLRGIDLSVPTGDVVVLLGANGAGKSTLLRTISGLTTIRAGSIDLAGKELAGLAPHTIDRLGVCHVTEGRAIFRSLTVAENLRVFDRRRSPDTLERAFGIFPILKERAGQVAGSLSGGQQQMLALARALVSEHPLLLLDELSMGLAPVIIDELFEVLAQLKEQRRSVLLVEQYARRALGLADLAYVLANGEMAFAGEPAELTDSPRLMSLYLGEGEGGSKARPRRPAPAR